MSIAKRVALCRMIEKMERQKSFAGRLGMENTSSFRGRPLTKRTNDCECHIS